VVLVVELSPDLEIVQPLRPGASCKPIDETVLNDVVGFDLDEGLIDVLYGRIPSCIPPEGPAVFVLQAEVGSEGVEDAVFQYLIRGIGTRGIVADPAGYGAGIRVFCIHAVRCEAVGIEEGLPDQPLHLPRAHGPLTHGAPLQSSYPGFSRIDASEPQTLKRVVGGAPPTKGVFDEVVEVLLEDGYIQEAFPSASLAELEALFEAHFHVGGRFRSNVQRGENVDAAYRGLDELLRDAGEPEPLPHAGTEEAGLSKPIVEAGSKDAFSSGNAVQREVLISTAKGQVKPVLGVCVELQISGSVGGIMDGIAHPGSV
jgi:hypothetical protein